MSRFLEFFGATDVAASLISSGAAALMMVTYNQAKTVCKTKNTVGLPTRFLAVSCCTCVLLGLTSIFGLLNWNWEDAKEWHFIDIVFVVINVCLFGANLYCLKVKQENLKKAREAGMSEADYYTQVIEPKLPKEGDKLEATGKKKGLKLAGKR